MALDWSRRHGGQRVKISRKAMDQLLLNLRGLTLQGARQLARSAIFNDGAITSTDVRRVMEEKFVLLNQAGVLSFEMDLAPAWPNSEAGSIARMSAALKPICKRFWPEKARRSRKSGLSLPTETSFILMAVDRC